MKTTKSFLLSAILIALAFAFSCSDDSGNNNGTQQDTQVYCQLTGGTCSQMSLSTCMELVNAGTAQIAANCNTNSPNTPQEVLGNISIFNITQYNQDVIRKVTIYSGLWCTVKCEEWDGINQAGTPIKTITVPINVGAQNDFTLPVGAYTVVAEDNSNHSYKTVMSSLPNGRTNIAWNGLQLDVEMEGGNNSANIATGSITLYNIPTSSNVSIRKVSIYEGTWKVITDKTSWTVGLDPKANSYKERDYSTPIVTNGNAKIGDFIPGAYTMVVETNSSQTFITELPVQSGTSMNVTFTGSQLEVSGGS